MNKKLLIAFFLLIFLTSCNFPLRTATVDQSVVATNVADVLTKAVNPTAAIQQPGDTPSVGTSTTTPQLPTATVDQSATPTLTSTITPTPTLSDPSKAYGDPLWHNTLDSGSAFGLSSVYNDGSTEIYISGGKMVLTSLSGAGWKGWRLTDRGQPNFYLEGTFITEGCSGLDSYGLVFRAPDYSTGYGYYFAATCDGRYSLMRWSSDGEIYLQNWQTSNEINAGSNQTNKLGVSADGINLKLYMNSKLIQEISDPTFPAATRIGVFVAGVNTGFTVELDQLDLWRIP